MFDRDYLRSVKVYIIFPSSSPPFQVEAESYVRVNDVIHFQTQGQNVQSVRADGLLTIVEQKDDDESKEA